MDIRVVEPLYIRSQGQEYIVRPGTIGVDKNRVIFFYDVTRTASVGFSRDFCLENPQLFKVARTLSDKEVSIRDVLKMAEQASYLSSEQLSHLLDDIKNL